MTGLSGYGHESAASVCGPKITRKQKQVILGRARRHFGILEMPKTTPTTKRSAHTRTNGPYERVQPAGRLPPKPGSLYSPDVGVDGARNGRKEREAIGAMMALAEAELERSRVHESTARSTYEPTSPSPSPNPMDLTPQHYNEIIASGGSLPSGFNIVRIYSPEIPPAEVVRLANGTKLYRIGFDFGSDCEIKLNALAEPIVGAVAGLDPQMRVGMSFTIGKNDSATADLETISELRTLLAALAVTRPTVDVGIFTAEHRVLGLPAFSEEEGELDAHREQYADYVSRLRVAAE